MPGSPDADRYLDVTARTLGWRADAPCWLDVAFESCVDRATADGKCRAREAVIKGRRSSSSTRRTAGQPGHGRGGRDRDRTGAQTETAVAFLLFVERSALMAGASWTDTGRRREGRQLKRRAPDDVRVVPGPPALTSSPFALRPYDLRHAAVSTWLDAGVGRTQVAEWAGHSVALLLQVYANPDRRHRGDAALRFRHSI